MIVVETSTYSLHPSMIAFKKAKEKATLVTYRLLR